MADPVSVQVLNQYHPQKGSENPAELSSVHTGGLCHIIQRNVLPVAAVYIVQRRLDLRKVLFVPNITRIRLYFSLPPKQVLNPKDCRFRQQFVAGFSFPKQSANLIQIL